MTINYLVDNYKDDPRQFNEFLQIIGRVKFNDRIFMVVHDTMVKENYIREYFSAMKESDMLKPDDILVSIENDPDADNLFHLLHKICKDNGILT